MELSRSLLYFLEHYWFFYISNCYYCSIIELSFDFFLSFFCLDPPSLLGTSKNPIGNLPTFKLKECDLNFLRASFFSWWKPSLLCWLFGSWPGRGLAPRSLKDGCINMLKFGVGASKFSWFSLLNSDKISFWRLVIRSMQNDLDLERAL